MESSRQTWTTGSLETWALGDSSGVPAPGLVLVYSRLHATLPPAIALNPAATTIGRESDNGLVIQEGAVSRYHARIDRTPQGDIVHDLGSTNGTIVNGRRVSWHALADHDVIRVGDTVFRYTSAHVFRYGAYRITGEKDAARAPQHGILDPLLVGGMQVDLLLDQIAKVAPTNLSVVVHGESGTGKELVARELHRWSGRPGPFQAINCAALPANLLESELFGYRRGAFTGATQDKIGLVQAAHGGTLFLDEIGDMPVEAQAKLLRVLQEREVLPLGTTQPVKVDVRVVAATHRNLDAFVTEGRFRGDLLARLREVPIVLPALRHRREDLFPLVSHFLRRAGRANNPVSLAFMLALAHYDFPYNVRELESAVRLALAMAEHGELDARHLPATVQQSLEGHGSRPQAAHGFHDPMGQTAPRVPIGLGEPPTAAAWGSRAAFPGYAAPPAAPGTPYPAAPPAEARGGAPDEAELRALLARHKGNIAAVGRELGKERMQIHRWLRRYDIDVESYRH